MQLGIFWTATAWLATLFMGPAVSGVEPKYQRAGVNILFAALVIVAGTMFGTRYATRQRMGLNELPVRPPGYEYVDLG